MAGSIRPRWAAVVSVAEKIGCSAHTLNEWVVRRQIIWLRLGRRLAGCRARLRVMLCGDFSVLQAPMLDGQAFDPFALFDDGCGPAEVGVGWCDVIQALVVAPVVVILNEGGDLGLKITGLEVVFEQNAVLEGLVPALDLALGLGMHWRAPDVAHSPALDMVVALEQSSRDHYR